MNKNNKTIIKLLTLLFIVITIFCFYSAAILNSIFIAGNLDLKQLKIIAILKSMSLNKNHFMLFILLDILLVGFLLFQLMNKKNNYKAETRKITEKIETPIKAGQGQYGTADWLDKNEYGNVFSKIEIDISKGYHKYLYDYGLLLRDEILTKTPTKPQRIIIPDDKSIKGGIVVNYEKDKKNNKEIFYYIGDDIHTCILSATRSGKTRRILLQSILNIALAGENIVLSDPKGELFDFTSPVLKALNYRVNVLDYKNPLMSDCYNYLQPIIDEVNNNNMPKAIDYVWDLTSILVKEPVGEKIWNDGESAIIAGSIMSVIYDNKDKPDLQNLTNVYAFILYMCKNINDEMPLNKYINDLDDRHPSKMIYGVAEIAPERTRGSFFTSALGTLRLFTNENIYTITSNTNIDIKDMDNRKTVTFLILPDNKKTYHSLASLFCLQTSSMLIDIADEKGGRLDRRTFFLLEEFGSFPKMPNIMNLVTAAAGRGILLTFIIQSIAQLKEIYNEKICEIILDNCHLLAFLKTTSTETAEKISKNLGRYTTATNNESSSFNSKNISNSSSSGTTLIGRELLNTDEVMKIDKPHAIIMYSGKNPALTKLPDLSKTFFNVMLGLGDEKFNEEVRMYRSKKRRKKEIKKIELWGIWNEYRNKEKNEYAPKENIKYTQYELDQMNKSKNEFYENQNTDYYDED